MMKYIIVLSLLLFSCSESVTSLNAKLDVFVGMDKVELYKTLGIPDGIPLTGGIDGQIITYHLGRTQIVYSIKFPEGIYIGEHYDYIEFYINEDNRIESWIGFK